MKNPRSSRKKSVSMTTTPASFVGVRWMSIVTPQRARGWRRRGGPFPRRTSANAGHKELRRREEPGDDLGEADHGVLRALELSSERLGLLLQVADPSPHR